MDIWCFETLSLSTSSSWFFWGTGIKSDVMRVFCTSTNRNARYVWETKLGGKTQRNRIVKAPPSVKFCNCFRRVATRKPHLLKAVGRKPLSVFLQGGVFTGGSIIFTNDPQMTKNRGEGATNYVLQCRREPQGSRGQRVTQQDLRVGMGGTPFPFFFS